MTNTKFINGFKLMKKLLFLIPLIAFGFFLAVFYIPGSQKTTSASNPDNPGDPSVTDSFTTTNMVASHKHLIVDTAAGQVRLGIPVNYGMKSNSSCEFVEGGPYRWICASCGDYCSCFGGENCYYNHVYGGCSYSDEGPVCSCGGAHFYWYANAYFKNNPYPCGYCVCDI